MTRKVAIAFVTAAVLLGSAVGWGLAATSSGSTRHWFNVGPGWILDSRTLNTGTSRSVIWVELIDPHAAVHRVFQAPGDAQVGAWSPDGRRALLEGFFRSKRYAAEVVDLRTGGVTHVSVPGISSSTRVLGFTRPDGTGLLTLNEAAAGGTLQRRALDGSHPVTLATHVSWSWFGTAVSTADGQAYLVVQNDQIVLVPDHVTSVSVALAGSAGCVPVRMWSRSQLLALCGESDATALLGTGRLELLPLQGGAVQVLARDTAYPLQINADAYVARGAVYAKTMTGCGPPWISRVARNGTVSPLPTTKNGPVAYTLLSSNRRDLLVELTRAGCIGGTRASLAWMDPATQTTRLIVSLPMSQGPTFLPFPTYNGVE